VWLLAACAVIAVGVATPIVVTSGHGGGAEPPPTVRPAAQTWDSGVFAGYGPAGDEKFAAWRGAPIQTATDFVSGQTWSQIEDPTTTIDAWRSEPDVQLALSTPMWPASPGGSLAAAASGTYNTYFASLGRALVAAGRDDTIMRIGWEFNTTFYRWSVTTAADAANYAAAWRQIVTAMRGVPGQHFGFVWNPAIQTDGTSPELSYPGDKYVTAIGLDVYDRNRVSGQSPQARWNDLVTTGYGLQWQAGFAAAHHKPIAFPEWGLVSQPRNPGIGGGDDPYFVTQMREWFASHRTAFEDYFNSDTTYGAYFGLTTGSGKFPNAARTYRSLYAAR
jgi:hypothetical protein